MDLTIMSSSIRNKRGADRRPLPPRVWSIRPSDVIAVFFFNAALIVGMWVRHGGLQLLGSASANYTALGELTALLGTYGALVQIVLMSRSPWLERRLGMDRLAHWHRWLGFTTVTLICAHVVFTTVGYALGDGKSVMQETWTFLSAYPYVLMATVATVMLIVIAFTSVRAARRRLKYETWHFIHFYTYLAIALAFGHELAVGTDLSTDHVAQAYWIALYVAVIVCVVSFRIGAPLRSTLRHGLRISKVVPEAPGVVSIYMEGRHLDQLHSRAGQFFNWRFLTSGGWWRPHPFSLSAAPNGEYLRITVKRVGEGTGDVHRLRPGTRVAIEGPYGVFTSLVRSRPQVLLIAGGIGITPLRALLEEFPSGKGQVTLLYRASSWEDVVFQEELERIAKIRQTQLLFLVGRREQVRGSSDPFSAKGLRALVPDVRKRDVFICGPPGMMESVSEVLESLGVPATQIHYERFALL
jgi:predicted ferric reductase